MSVSEQDSAEQQIPQLRIFRPSGPTEDSVQESKQKREELDKDKVEAFWAGRNSAMRRSARIAA